MIHVLLFVLHVSVLCGYEWYTWFRCSTTGDVLEMSVVRCWWSV